MGSLTNVVCAVLLLASLLHGAESWWWGRRSSSSSSSATTVTTTTTAAPQSNVNCFGNIDDLSPTGKGSGGVSASQSAVRYRLSTLNQYVKACSETIARNNCFPASVIGALASRESNGGASLDSNGYGDNGNGYGIMQCDNKSGLSCTRYGARSCSHITMMVEQLLIPYVRTVQRNHPTWTRAQQLQGGVAAYNFGTGNVQSWGGLDRGTTGNDYSNDVIARAQYLRSLGWS